MLPYYSRYICGTWRNKNVGGLKLSNGRKRKTHLQEEPLCSIIKKTTQEVDH